MNGCNYIRVTAEGAEDRLKRSVAYGSSVHVFPQGQKKSTFLFVHISFQIFLRDILFSVFTFQISFLLFLPVFIASAVSMAVSIEWSILLYLC